MNTACRGEVFRDKLRLRLVVLVLGLTLTSCVASGEREIRVEPAGRHDLKADRAICSDYADRYGVINLGPMMGDQAQNRPDRRRRNRLFVLCMEEKGYRF